MTGSMPADDASFPSNQAWTKDTGVQSHKAECIPDIPPKAPSPGLASLTPSAMALLQPPASQQRGGQPQRHLYAPPSIFPGFATHEKLQPQAYPISEPYCVSTQHAQYAMGQHDVQQQPSSQGQQQQQQRYGIAEIPMPPGGIQSDSRGRHNSMAHVAPQPYSQQHAHERLQHGSPVMSGLTTGSGSDHRVPVQSPSRRSQSPMQGSGASMGSRAHVSSDTACKGQHSPLRPTAASGLARQGSGASSGGLPPIAGPWRAGGPMPGQLGSTARGQPSQSRQWPKQGSPAHARAVLQPRLQQHDSPGAQVNLAGACMQVRKAWHGGSVMQSEYGPCSTGCTRAGITLKPKRCCLQEGLMSLWRLHAGTRSCTDSAGHLHQDAGIQA